MRLLALIHVVCIILTQSVRSNNDGCLFSREFSIFLGEQGERRRIHEYAQKRVYGIQTSVWRMFLPGKVRRRHLPVPVQPNALLNAANILE